MSTFSLPSDLAFNTAKVLDPSAFAAEKKAASWLFLCGPEFSAMEGGISYSQVQAAVPRAAQVISDPPRTLNLELARQHIAALDALPRPTLVTCRSGPRASAVVYLYAALKANAAVGEVLAQAERDGAPFCKFDDYKTWLREVLEALSINLNPPKVSIAMNPNQALWEKGDFTKIALSMTESGAALVASLGVKSGMKVLDLGCGDGTTALPAAKLGADVLGVDIARNLVEAGNRRAKEQGLATARFVVGDASALTDLADRSFDLVVSIFGAMFAPKPFDVAKEMVRVTRPGGRIVMGNWIPNDPTLVAQILKISSAYSPPPPEGFISPITWGVENNAVERFGAAGIAKEKIAFSKETYTFNHPGTPAELLAEFRNYYGPTMNAFEAAAKNGKDADLQRELEALFTSQNKKAGRQGTSIPATFLRITVSV